MRSLILKEPRSGWTRLLRRRRNRLRKVFQFCRGHMLLVLDPLWRGFPLFIWTVHRECRHDTLFPQPPYAEALAGKIAAVNDLLRTGRIAPIFIGEIEHVRKE